MQQIHFKYKNWFLKLQVLLIVAFFSFSSCSEDDKPITEEQEEIDNDIPVLLTGEIEWIKTLGGSRIDQAVSITSTTDGNYMVLAHTNSPDGDVTGKTTTDSDYWLLKINSQGTILWNRIYGNEEDEVATKINNTNDGGYIISGYSRSNNCGVDSNAGFQDFWILKLNSTGEEQWCKNFGFSGVDQAFDVFQTQDGGYFATGFLDVTASGGQGNDDRANNQTQHGVGEFWCIKMDSNGDYIWRRFFGGSNNDRSYDALQTNDGGFIVTGASESTDFDITDDKGSYDFWAIKISPNGNKEWTKSYGGSSIDVAYAITESDDGNYIIVGDARSSDKDVTNAFGNADLWLVKIAPNGNLISQKSFGGSQFESAKNIRRISQNKYILTGSSRSNDNDVSVNKGQNDAWMVIIDEAHNLIFEKTIGGTSFDFGEDAIQTPDGGIILVGNTESNDVDISNNKGLKDVLIVKIK